MARTTRADDSYGHDGERPIRRHSRWSRWALGLVATNLGVAGLSYSGYDNGAISGVAQVVRDRFTQTRTSVRNRSLAQQIGERIRQEKTIEADRIEVSVEDESTAILEGLVADAGDKEKAVALTRDTRGVRKVIDRLAVIPASRVIDAPAAPDAAASTSTAAGVAELPRITR